jgi:hypothetical protein
MTMKKEDHPVTEMVEKGMSVMRMENETQMQMAAQKPRNEVKALEMVLMEMDVVPKLAETYFYSIPYKKPDGGIENVRGLSIKAAMSIAGRWGNSAVGARVIQDEPDRVRVEGVLLDYENNLRVMRELTVSKKQWRKSLNAFVTLDPTRLQMAIQSGMSKAMRNVILARVPEFIKAAVFNKAVDIASGRLAKSVAGKKVANTEDRIKAAITKFVKMGATEAGVKGYIDGLAVETQEEVLRDLIGLFNAINDGQTSIADVFGQKDEPAQKEKRDGDVALADVIGDEGA